MSLQRRDNMPSSRHRVFHHRHFTWRTVNVAWRGKEESDCNSHWCWFSNRFKSLSGGSSHSPSSRSQLHCWFFAHCSARRRPLSRSLTKLYLLPGSPQSSHCSLASPLACHLHGPDLSRCILVELCWQDRQYKIRLFVFLLFGKWTFRR